MFDMNNATPEQITAEIARLQAENAALRVAKASKNKLSLKVSDKGGVSVYGLGRFPVTLYGEQWARLLDAKDEIVAFVTANADALTTKADSVAAKALTAKA